MVKTTKIESGSFQGYTGVIDCAIYFPLEKEKYIIPESVTIKLNDEYLIPTSFDEHGNPRIDGIADLIFLWKKRQMVRDGLIDSQYSELIAECKYDIADGYIEIPIEDRILKNTFCPMCSKKIETWELNGNVESHENYLFHKSCLKEFLKLEMIDKITESVYWGLHIRDLKWKQDIDYTLLPNGYCGDSCCPHRPWFLFTTPYGKIKVGWRKRVISMTFFDGFKGIKFDELFKDEDVTKGYDDGGYNIHAWGYEKMQEYLYKIKDELKKEVKNG